MSLTVAELADKLRLSPRGWLLLVLGWLAALEEGLLRVLWILAGRDI